MAEAGAFHGDLVLSLHQELQKGLWQKKTADWATFAEIKRAMTFSAHAADVVGKQDANVGIVIGDYRALTNPSICWRATTFHFACCGLLI